MIVGMKIILTTTPEQVRDYYEHKQRTFFGPLSASFRAHIATAKADRAEVVRLGYALEAAERRIVELEQQVACLDNYRVIVDEVLADAGA